MARVKNVVLIDMVRTKALLHQRILGAVNDTATAAYDLARKEVPVRKVFRYGRTKLGDRFGHRQDVRTLSISEALSEAPARRRLGLPSAFPTSAAGRRSSGSQPAVKTTQLTPTYRAHDRANSWSRGRREIAAINGVNHIVKSEDVFESRKRGLSGETVHEKVGYKLTIDTQAESDLSSRGRYELSRAVPSGGEKLATLGGALRKSIEMIPAEDGRRITAYVTAGGGDVDYAKYVEFGTRRSRAQPFMRPAKALVREEFAAKLRAHLGGVGSGRK